MCILCEIDPKLVLLESANSVLLANYFPLSDCSLMVIPKRHVYSITELSGGEASDFMQMIVMATNKIKANLNPEGINIFLNEGEIAGQTVPHLHFHIVARSENDGLENFKRNGDKKIITEEALNKIKNCF